MKSVVKEQNRYPEIFYVKKKLDETCLGDHKKALIHNILSWKQI